MSRWLEMLSRKATARLSDEKSGLAVCPDPVDFAREYLGVECWSRQAELLRAVAEHDRVAWRSGHKVGKSASAAILALWWFTTKPTGRVIMTSSSGRQVKEILWREIRAMHGGARKKLDGYPAVLPATGLSTPDGRQIVGFSTEDKEKMAGFSGANLLYIVDEASGVEEEIFDAIEGNRAGGAKMVMFSNPTQTSGKFYEAFHLKREFWHRIHVSSEESPNITGEANIPGLAIKSWVDEQILEHGDPSPFVDVRIRGNFPSQSENAVIGIGLVERAVLGWEEPTIEDGPLELGVDVARFGDDKTVLQARRGPKAYRARVLSSMDTVAVAGETLKYAAELKREGDPKVRVKVDVIGIGAGVVDHLNRHGEIECVSVNVAESATDEQYSRLRDQLWFGCRDWLKEGGKFQPNPMLENELIAPTYSFDAQGRMKVSSKDEIKKKIHRSPDNGDALCLSIYNPPKRMRARATAILDY